MPWSSRSTSTLPSRPGRRLAVGLRERAGAPPRRRRRGRPPAAGRHHRRRTSTSGPTAARTGTGPGRLRVGRPGRVRRRRTGSSGTAAIVPDRPTGRADAAVGAAGRGKFANGRGVGILGSRTPRVPAAAPRGRMSIRGGPVPTYQYACTECGHAFEQFQSFSDDALTVCPRVRGPAAQGVQRRRRGLQGLRLLPHRQPRRPPTAPARAHGAASTSERRRRPAPATRRRAPPSPRRRTTADPKKRVGRLGSSGSGASTSASGG